MNKAEKKGRKKEKITAKRKTKGKKIKRNRTRKRKNECRPPVGNSYS